MRGPFFLLAAEPAWAADSGVAGKQLGVMNEATFSIIVLMVILTTLITPPVLTLLLKQE